MKMEKKVKEVMTTNMTTGYDVFTYNYDSQGRRTTTIGTVYSESGIFSTTYTRTYNTDGSIQKVTFPLDGFDPTPVTLKYTLENGKIKTGTLEDQLPW